MRYSHWIDSDTLELRFRMGESLTVSAGPNGEAGTIAEIVIDPNDMEADARRVHLTTDQAHALAEALAKFSQR